jgi:multiple sugar transport system ATP-binding protein
MARIHIKHIRKNFGPVKVLNDFDLEIEDGEFVVLVGPSGCGKSTMLKILAGLEPASAGTIHIGDRDVTDLAPGDRDIAMVFQNYALYPHLTVAQNMGFGLKMRGMPRSDIARRVEVAGQTLGIEHLLERRPRELSGGQRQRVALGRAIVREPQAFLMDEPLSNLDAKLRVHMRAEISALHQRLGVTTVYVTHDQIEAMTMANRIVIMRDGSIQQIADPDTMFNRPKNLFVAGFIGSPGMNFMRAPLRIEAGTVMLDLFSQKVSLRIAPAAVSHLAGQEVIVGLRPEHLGAASGNTTSVLFETRVRLVESLGGDKYVFVDVPPANQMLREAAQTPAVTAKAAKRVTTGAEEQRRGDSIIARLINPGRLAAGATIRLEFDPRHLHVFDPHSELAIG